MAKRTRTYVEKHKRCGMDDHINRFPDELLAYILSFLSLKEAAATSLLSSRWRRLWHFISSLDFDASTTLKNLLRTMYRITNQVTVKSFETERSMYVDWVNRICELHKGSSLSEFRILFNLDNSFKQDIDKWMEFALVRKVRRLELDLYHPLLKSQNGNDLYSFPDEFLNLNKGGTYSSDNGYNQSFWRFRSCTLDHVKCLQTLRLRGVRVTGEALENILSTCPRLEHLAVFESSTLLHLKVMGPSLLLKHLEICDCWNMKSLEMRDAVGQWEYSSMILSKKMKKSTTRPHFNLKEVEYNGYFGSTNDVEMVMYLVENAVALEKLIIDPHQYLDYIYEIDTRSRLELEGARPRAKQLLEGKMPPGAQLLIR